VLLLLGRGGKKHHRQYTCNESLKQFRVTHIAVENENYYMF